MTATFLSESELPPVPYAGDTELRFIPIYASLLPDEIIAARRARETMRRVAVGLAALLVLLVAWYGLSVVQTSRAKANLTKAQEQEFRLQNQIKAFAPLVSAQTQTVTISKSLATLMRTDVRWYEVLRTLYKNATPGMTFETISGDVPSGIGTTTSQGTSQSGGLGVLNDSGKQQIGTLSITGTAPDRAAVATFVEQLDKVSGFTAPFPASVTSNGGASVKFDLTAIITSDLLGGRYTQQPGTASLEGK